LIYLFGQIASKMAPKSKAKSRSSSPKAKAKSKADIEAENKKQREKELQDKLDEALELLFKCYDTDKDDHVERVELLEGLEKEFEVRGANLGIKEKKAAIAWFKESSVSRDGGMYADKAQFVAGKKTDLETTSGEEPGSEAHVTFVEDLARKLHNLLNPVKAAKKVVEFPVTIGLKQLDDFIKAAYELNKVPLILCGGAEPPKQFLLYSSHAGSVIDAKAILGEVYIRKKKTIEQVQGELKLKLIGAQHTAGGVGTTLQIQMGNTATDFNKICGAEFPAAIFGGPDKWTQAECHKVFGPLIFIQEGFRVMVVSDFDKESAMKHLPAGLPFFDSMAIIEIDVSTL